jgi:methyl-accepting chemotaxis protein-2 (aspartate sensor receptor)
VVLVLILVVVWYGIRHALLNPLSRVIAHIREIASGNLTATLAVRVAMKLPSWPAR